MAAQRIVQQKRRWSSYGFIVEPPFQRPLCDLGSPVLVPCISKSLTDLYQASSSCEDEVQFQLSLEKEKSTLKKGLLWQQRDKLFSRWKERYFILTPDYLHCFKRGTSRITEMGGFIFKIKCSEVEDVELLDKRGYLTICVSLPREGKVYLRKTEGIREWFNLLKNCIRECKKRRLSGGNVWSKKQVTDSSSIENWLQARRKIGLQYAYSDSTPEINKIGGSLNGTPGGNKASCGQRVEITLEELSELYKKEEEEQQQRNTASSIDRIRPSPKNVNLRHSRESSPTKKINRLSLMSDIELPELLTTTDLGIDLEKGIFLRKKCSNLFSPGDTESNDSGNNSMNTNGSVGSTNSSDSTHNREDRLETHFEDKELSDHITTTKELSKQIKRRSHIQGLQITHV